MAGNVFTDPLQLFGFSFVIATALLQLILAPKEYRVYLMNRSKPTLAISLTFFEWGFALIFLALERLVLTVFGDTNLGYPCAYIAIVFSALAIIFLNLFAFYATFPNQVKKLIIPSIFLSIIYLIGVFLSSIATGPDMEIVFQPYLDIVMLFTVLPLFLIPIIILVYYSHKMKFRSAPHARRSAWLAIAIILVVLSYIPEIIGPPALIDYLRGLYMIATIIFYFCFTRFIELRWAEKIHHLYICLADKGTCLYDHSFIEEEALECSLVTGFISGISSLVKEITHSQKRLKVIDVEDIKLLIEHGNKKTIGILLTEEIYKILRTKLRRLLEIFEEEFENELDAFSGYVSPFKRTKKFVERIFVYKEIF